MRRLVRLLGGCYPDYNHPCELAPNYIVPCKRCGAADTDYADRVGDTRENAAKDMAHTDAEAHDGIAMNSGHPLDGADTIALA